MQLTIEIPNEQLFNKIVWLLNAFKSEGLKINTHNQTPTLNHEKPSKNQFSEFSGMWKERDITQESIREQAWK